MRIKMIYILYFLNEKSFDNNNMEDASINY